MGGSDPIQSAKLIGGELAISALLAIHQPHKFLAADFVLVGLLIAFPSLALWLPALLRV